MIVFQNMGVIQHVWVPLTVVGVFAFLIIQCFLTAFEVSALKYIANHFSW